MNAKLICTCLLVTGIAAYWYFSYDTEASDSVSPLARLQAEKDANNGYKQNRSSINQAVKNKYSDLDSTIKHSEKVSSTEPTRVSHTNNQTTAFEKLKAEMLDTLANIEKIKELDKLVFSWRPALCAECVESLKQILNDSTYDQKIRKNAAFALAKMGVSQSVTALVESLHDGEMTGITTGLSKQTVNKVFRAIQDPEGISALAYILTGQHNELPITELSDALKSTMNKAIMNFSDRQSVAYELTKQYWNTENADVKQAIVDLNHTETLALLAHDSAAYNDNAMQNELIETLSKNGKIETLDSLMALAKKDLVVQPELQAKLDEWTQATNSVVLHDHLVDYLSNPETSVAQRQIAADLLRNIMENPDMIQNSVEGEKISNALNKYQQHT